MHVWHKPLPLSCLIEMNIDINFFSSEFWSSCTFFDGKTSSVNVCNSHICERAFPKKCVLHETRVVSSIFVQSFQTAVCRGVQATKTPNNKWVPQWSDDFYHGQPAYVFEGKGRKAKSLSETPHCCVPSTFSRWGDVNWDLRF